MSSEIYFTSDTHFGHRRIVELSGRPFADVEAMDEAIIERWNAVVRPTDRVYHLGDVSFANRERTIEILERLNGEIHLVLGNHDRPATRPGVVERFASVAPYVEVEVADQRLVLFHYPILVWNWAHYGSWHLHGHCHGGLPDDPGAPRLDVGVDVHDFTPLSFDQVRERLAGREWEPVDHHDGER